MQKPVVLIAVFRFMNKFARFIINCLTRFILTCAYYILFFPFAVFVLIFSDLLNIRNFHNPRWDKCEEIKDDNKFLRQQ